MNEIFLSLCMIVKNESQNLARCLESVKELVDEIIIVDTGSSDNTKDIALAYGAQIYDYQWNDDFAAARNYANKHATGAWIISLDADEQIVSNTDIKFHIQSLPTSIISTCLYRYSASINSLELINEGYYWRIFRRLPNLHFKGRIHEQLYLQDKPLEPNQMDWISQDATFIKHYGDSDGKSLQKIIDFYIPMLERISINRQLTLMELSFLQDYYLKVQEFDKRLECFREVFERLTPNLLIGEKPSDFIFVPSWLLNLGDYFLREDDLENLVLIATRGAQWFSKYPPILVLAGKALLKIGFPLGALSYFQSCIDCINSNSFESSAHFECISVYYAYYLAAESYYSQGCIYMQFEQWDKAAMAFESCLAINDEEFKDVAKTQLLIVREHLSSGV